MSLILPKINGHGMGYVTDHGHMNVVQMTRDGSGDMVGTDCWI